MGVRFLYAGCLALLAISAPQVTAQNRFFEEDQSGATLGASFLAGEDSWGLGAGFQYSFSCQLDIGISLARSSFDKDIYGDNFSAKSVSPYVSYTVIKAKGGSQFGFELFTDYTYTLFSGDVLGYPNWDSSGRSISAGGEVYLRLDDSENLRLFPAFGVAYTDVSNNAHDALNGRDSGVSDALLFGSVAMIIGQKFIISPAVSSFNGSTTWGVSFGYAMPNTRF